MFDRTTRWVCEGRTGPLAGAIEIVRRGEVPRSPMGVVLAVPQGGRRECRSRGIAGIRREELLLGLKEAGQDTGL